MRPAVAIAAVRANGSIDLGGEDRSALEQAAPLLSRHVHELGGGEVAVGWAEGYGPALDDPALVIPELSQTRLVALGLVLALCYSPDLGRRGHRRVAVDDVLEAGSQLRAAPVPAGEHAVAHAHVKGSLADLDEIGLVDLSDDTVGLGPALGAWSDAEWSALDALHPRLAAAIR